MANAGHIWVPMDTQLRLQAEWHEYDAARKVYRRPWVYGERTRMQGKVKTVMNLPFTNEKGELIRWNPLMTACFAVLEAGACVGFDVVRVCTPSDEQVPGRKATAEIDFSVAQLMELSHRDSIFYTEVKNGHIRFEDEAANVMSPNWTMSSDGVFAPEAK